MSSHAPALSALVPVTGRHDDLGELHRAIVPELAKLDPAFEVIYLVGTSSGVFLSPTGTEPWALSSLGRVPILWSALALRCSTVFAAFDEPTFAALALSRDGGASWRFLDVQNGVFVFAMAFHGRDLYAARGDGLWRRETGIQCGGPFAPAVSAVTSQPAEVMVRDGNEGPQRLIMSLAITVAMISGRRRWLRIASLYLRSGLGK